MENVKINNIKIIESEPVFDIEVADAHHYVLGNGIVCHNSGLIYASDCIALLSKSKDRDKDRNIVGNIVKVRMEKSRLSRENSEVEVRISYSGGLDRYHGLLDMAVEAGLVQCSNGRYTFPGEQKAVTANKIAASPETYFTEDFLKKLDEQYIRPNFSYGSNELKSVTSKDSFDDDEN